MITEDYVSFETAKLLKKKGFPQEYDRYHALVYNEEDYKDEYEVQRMVLETKLVKAGTLSSYPVGVPDPKCYCCTLQMAMKWLREVHKLNIHINVCNKYFDNDPKKDLCYVWYINEIKPGVKHLTSIAYENTYEQAAEAAIKYCLENLI